MRHWHKYSSAFLPAARRFYFRAPTGLTGAVAGNMEEFHRELRRVPLAVVRHHARGGDFSRWVADVLRDETLAAAFRLSEQRLGDAVPEAEAEPVRRELLAAIGIRYASSRG